MIDPKRTPFERALQSTVLAALLAALAVGCAAVNQPVSGSRRLDQASRLECERHCETLGMQLCAVVLILNSAGCVCEPVGEESEASASGAAAAAGGAAIVAAVEVQQRAQASASPR